MLSLKALLVATMFLLAGGASADEALDSEARAALATFTGAVMAGPEAVEAVLAPEYQIMRSNGVGYDMQGYIASVSGVKLAPDIGYHNIVATADGDIMVVRYELEVDETIDGAKVARRAPRLTVFRRIDGQWKVSAHANFAAQEPDAN